MRGKVIPKAGLCLETPIVLGLTAGAMLGVRTINTAPGVPVWVPLLTIASMLSPIVVFIVFSETMRRVYRRVLVRTAVFTGAYFIGLLLHESYADPSVLTGLLTSLSDAGTFALSVSIFVAIGAFASLPVIAVMNLVAGKHRVQNGDLCDACGYDLRGLNDRGTCPECGGSPGEHEAKQLRAMLLMKIAMGIVCLVLLLGGAFRLAPVLLKTGFPMARFMWSLPASDQSAGWIERPIHAQSPILSSQRYSIARTINIEQLAADEQIDATHLFATFEVSATGGTREIQFRLSKLDGNTLLPSHPQILWDIKSSEVAEFYSSGGLTSERIRLLLRDAKERGPSVGRSGTFVPVPW